MARGRLVSVGRCIKCSTDVTPEITALVTISASTTRPARSSLRWYPYGNCFVGARPLSTNAMASATVVETSPRLCRPSASTPALDEIAAAASSSAATAASTNELMPTTRSAPPPLGAATP